MRTRYLIYLWTGLLTITTSFELYGQSNGISSNGTPSNVLLETAHRLNCSITEEHANSALDKLRNNVQPNLLLPNENGSGIEPFSLHAGSMDILFKALTDITKKFPNTSQNVEKVILQWSYCEILVDDELFDHTQINDKIVRRRVEYSSPIGWSGFQSMGFFDDKNNRFEFSAYRYGDVPHRFYEERYHMLFRQKCLPHPATGNLYIDKSTYFDSKILAMDEPVTNSYPFIFENSCSVDEVANDLSHYQLEKIDIQRVAAEKLAAEKLAAEKLAAEKLAAEKLAAEKLAAEKLAAEKLAAEKLAAEKLAAEKLAAEKLAAEKLAAEKLAAEKLAAEKLAAEKLAAGKLAAEKLTANTNVQSEKDTTDSHSPDVTLDTTPMLGSALPPNRNVESPATTDFLASVDKSPLILNRNEEGVAQISTTDLKDDNEPKKEYVFKPKPPAISLTENSRLKLTNSIVQKDNKSKETIITTEPATGGIGNSVVIDTENEKDEKAKRKKIGVSGFFNISNRSFDHDGFALGGGISYKPIKDSYWFMRTSFKLKDADDPLTYSWGIGYDDWHKKTWSIQLNHWGPLKPGDGFDEQNAIGSISYKFGSAFLSKYKLGSFASFSQKLSGDPVFTWGLSWSPRPKWFIRSSFSKNLTGGDITWTYGFGYANYSPFTWSLEYNNWGLNEALDTNFEDNGIVTLTYRWSF